MKRQQNRTGEVFSFELLLDNEEKEAGVDYSNTYEECHMIQECQTQGTEKESPPRMRRMKGKYFRKRMKIKKRKASNTLPSSWKGWERWKKKKAQKILSEDVINWIVLINLLTQNPFLSYNLLNRLNNCGSDALVR